MQTTRLTGGYAIVAVSSKLRSRAKRNGIEVDDIFRNVNGITLQMSTMEYILTDGEKGMKKSSMPKLFQDAVAMYQNDRATYEKMLREARNVPDITNCQQRRSMSYGTDSCWRRGVDNISLSL